MVLTFNGRANIGVSIVQQAYPDAQLLEVSASASAGPTHDPKQLCDMQLVFMLPEGRTVVIRETSWGEFGEPEVIDEPFVGNVILSWPIAMELEDAIARKEAAGHREPFVAVTLRQPLIPDVSHPFFIFTGADGSHVFVEVVSGQISSSTLALGSSTRSVAVQLMNQSDQVLRRSTWRLDMGVWARNRLPPETIQPGETAYWRNDSNGFLTGAAGFVAYETDLGTVEFEWLNRYWVSANRYTESAPEGIRLRVDGGGGRNAEVDVLITNALSL